MLHIWSACPSMPTCCGAAAGTALPAQQQAAEPEHRISPEEAKELLNSVDKILEFGSETTGMSVHHRVKRELAGRDQVQKFVETRLREDEAVRIEGMREAPAEIIRWALMEDAESWQHDAAVG